MLWLNRALLALLLFSTTGPSHPKLVVPNFPSFRLKTRVRFGARTSSSVQTLYMQGPRTRAEYEPETPTPVPGGEEQLRIIILTQCDRKRTIGFDPQHKTFTEWPIREFGQRGKRSGGRHEPTGSEVSVNIDSVDTGERRQVGPYLARHVRTTVRIVPGTNATTHPRTEERDGWYIDLGQMNCEDWGDQQPEKVGWLTTTSDKRVQVSHTGSGKRGYPVEEFSKAASSGRTYETRLELVEASSDPIDPQLFDLPAGYVHALQSPLGTDYSKPDTLTNRAAAYWTYIRQRMARASRGCP